jgi:hypothetical protein
MNCSHRSRLHILAALHHTCMLHPITIGVRYDVLGGAVSHRERQAEEQFWCTLAQENEISGFRDDQLEQRRTQQKHIFMRDSAVALSDLVQDGLLALP